MSTCVLIVEPDAAAAERALLFLMGRGHRVSTVPGVRAALTSARLDPPEVVLVALHLPGGEAAGLMRAMRADAALRGLALVAVGETTGPSGLGRPAPAGFDDHLGVPLDLEALADLVGRYCRHPPRARARRTATS